MVVDILVKVGKYGNLNAIEENVCVLWFVFASNTEISEFQNDKSSFRTVPLRTKLASFMGYSKLHLR